MVKLHETDLALFFILLSFRHTYISTFCNGRTTTNAAHSTIIQLSQQVDKVTRQVNAVTAVVIGQDAQLRATQTALTATQSQLTDTQAALIDLLKEKNARLKVAEEERILQAKNSKLLAIAQKCALGAAKLGIFRGASVILKQYSQTIMPGDFLTNEILPDLCATVVAQQAPQLVWKVYEGLGTMTNR